MDCRAHRFSAPGRRGVNGQKRRSPAATGLQDEIARENYQRTQLTTSPADEFARGEAFYAVRRDTGEAYRFPEVYLPRVMTGDHWSEITAMPALWVRHPELAAAHLCDLVSRQCRRCRE